MDEGERDHYMFLHAALAKCERCLASWLHHGAPSARGWSWTCTCTCPKLAVQRRNACAQVGGDDRSSFFGFWSFGADHQGRSVAVASAALSGNLERLKDIESDDCSIFIQRPGVEDANLPDVLGHWTLREYVELACLRAASGSSRRHSL